MWAETETSVLLNIDYTNVSTPAWTVTGGSGEVKDGTWIHHQDGGSGSRTAYINLGVAGNIDDNYTVCYDFKATTTSTWTTNGNVQTAVIAEANTYVVNGAQSSGILFGVNAVMNKANMGNDLSYAITLNGENDGNVTLTNGVVYTITVSVDGTNLAASIFNGSTEVYSNTATLTSFVKPQGIFDCLPRPYNASWGVYSNVYDNIKVTKEVEAGIVENPTYAVSAINGISRTISLSCVTDGVSYLWSETAPVQDENYASWIAVSGSSFSTTNPTVYVVAKKDATFSEAITVSTTAGEEKTMPNPTIVRTGASTYTINADALNVDGLSITPTIHYTIGGGAEQTVTATSANLSNVNGDIVAWATATGVTNSNNTQMSYVAALDVVDKWSIGLNDYIRSNNSFDNFAAITAAESTTIGSWTVYQFNGNENIYLTNNGGWLFRPTNTAAFKAQSQVEGIVVTGLTTSHVIEVRAAKDGGGNAINSVNNGSVAYSYNDYNYFVVPSTDGAVKINFSKGTRIEAIYVKQLRSAALAGLTAGEDATFAIANPSFESNNSITTSIVGWTNNNGMQTQTNESFDNHQGHVYVEKWVKSGTLSDASITQTINGLPSGYYTLSAYAYFGGTGAYIKANTDETAVTADASGLYSVTTKVTDGTLAIEAGVKNATANWVCFDHFTLTYVGAADGSVTRSTASSRYGTLCLPYDFAADGAELYTVDGVEGNSIVLANAQSATEGVAGKPYLYCATADAQTFTQTSAPVAEPKEDEYLVGSFVPVPVPTGNYVLQTQDGRQGFYQVVAGTPITGGAFKCYLNGSKVSNGARAFFFDGEETAINALNALTSGKAEIFDLNGRRLERLQKGINIVNGTQILVK